MTLRPGRHARLTPGRVRSVSFRLARLGRRGFDEDDVQDFCYLVEEELSLLLEERAALQAELGRLRGWAQARIRGGAPAALPPGALPSGAAPLSAPVAGPAPGPPPGALVVPRPQSLALNDQSLRILAQAQQTAERCVSDARAYSQEVAHEAQRRREKILGEASAKAAELLEHAHQVAIRNNVVPEPRPAYDPRHRSEPRPTHNNSPAYNNNPAYNPGRNAYNPGTPYNPGTTYDPGRPARNPDHPAYNRSSPTGHPRFPGPRPSHRRDPRFPTYPSPPPAQPGPPGQPGPAGQSRPPGPPGRPPDYRTVADYPGPAAGYQVPPPDYRDQGRGDERYSDPYRGGQEGDSRFPF